MRGIGDELTPLDGARSVPLVLVRPGGGLSTPHVFAEYDRMAQARGEIDIEGAYRALACGNLHAYDRLSGNALEAPARKLMPEIGRVMERLRMEGAVGVRMSGSGSTVFGAFRKARTPRKSAMKALPGSVLARTIVHVSANFRSRRFFRINSLKMADANGTIRDDAGGCA